MFRLGRVRVIKPVSVFVNTSCHSMSTTEEPPFRCRIEPSSFLITEDFVRHSHISRQVSSRKNCFSSSFFLQNRGPVTASLSLRRTQGTNRELKCIDLCLPRALQTSGLHARKTARKLQSHSNITDISCEIIRLPQIQGTRQKLHVSVSHATSRCA